MHKIQQNIKIRTKTKEQFEKIQEICFDVGIFWIRSGECLQEIATNAGCKWICVRDNKLSVAYGVHSHGHAHGPEDLEEVDADLFIRTNGTCVEDVYDDLQKEDSEYLIFVEGKFKPSKIHTSLDEAEKEARRLCEKEMKEVHILKSVKKFKPKITIEEI